MAKLGDLIDPGIRNEPQGMTGLWRGYMIAPLPTTYADKMHVVISDIDPNTKFDTNRWMKGALSFVALNKEVLCAFDNRQNLWVIGIA